MIILEAIFVGFYTMVFVILSTQFIQNTFFSLFVAGFLKHYCGYYFGIHDLYCRLYERGRRSNGRHLFAESLAEGLVFAGAGEIFGQITNNPAEIGFLVGSSLHIIAEIVGIHKYYLTKCV